MVEIRWMANDLYKLMDRLMKLAYINFLWALFTLAGGIIFGLFPATAAMFAQLRAMILKHEQPSVFQHFIKTFKKEFLRTNMLATIFIPPGAVLAGNLYMMQQIEGLAGIVVAAATLLAVILYLNTSLFIFPVYSHYQLSLFTCMKVAVFLPFTNILAWIWAAAGTSFLFALFYFVPALLPFFGASSIAAVLTWSAGISFNKLGIRKTEDGSAKSQTEVC